jgi:Calx-beta domain/Carboxypeptidase regulatory-like domain/Beta-propeller repeat/Domain of unknown function (DUF4214)
MRGTSYSVNQWSRLAVLLTVICLVSGFALMGHSSNWRSAIITANARLARSKENAPIPLPSKVVAPDETTQQRLSETYGKLPLSFEVNQGQTNRHVKFLSRGSGYTLFLTSNEAVLSLHRSLVDDTSGRSDTAPDVLRMNLVAANPHARVEGLDQLPGKSNYFVGKNRRNWRTNVSTYRRVYYHEIYKGIDLVYYGNQRQLENDFVVAPSADVGDIALAFDGAKKITIDKGGNLLLQTSGGQVVLQKPVIYQLAEGVRQEVAGNYLLKSSGAVGFEVASYDHRQPLVIDPVLVYSSYLGGNGTEVGNAITVDDAGNAYITGDTTSSIFPTVSPFDSTLGGTEDAFIVKINSAGSALVYSTYLGGSSTETGIDISVDGAQNAYVTGRTASSDFPVVNAFDSTYSGGTDEDAFVVRINAAGSALVYSTYLSGNFGARGCGIWANNSQNFAYVTGTTSTGFPVTSSAFESTNFNSGFLTKLCTNCSGGASLVYSTFLAHTGFAEGRAIAADVAGNAYVTGNLNSTTTNFATPGAFQTTFGGGSADAFVEKFNTNLSGAAGRVYATYLGGSAKDIGGAEGSLNPGRAIAIDESGNAYITGATSSTNFPLANASQSVLGGQNDAFLTKLNATGSALIYSTYLGGTGDDFGKSVAVNVGGGAYVTGVAGPNFPTSNPLFTPNPGIGFVAKFAPSGTSVVYSTILSGVSGGSFGLALDLPGNAFATGSTNANIVTVNPFQPTNGGGGTDGWVSVIADPTIIGRVSDENGNPLQGATVNLTGVPTATTSTDANGGYTFGLLTAGNDYTVSVVAPGYIFGTAGVNNLQKNVRRDFGPSVVTISGQVTLSGSGLSGVTMTLGIGKSLSVQTNAQGNYIFNNLPAGRTYTVMPTKNLFQFNPQSILFFQLLSDVQTANFVATLAPTVQLSASNYSVSEGAGHIDITVTRTGDTSSLSSVYYSTTDTDTFTVGCSDTVNNMGGAYGRCDYSTSVDMLNFAPGETTKTFSVPIIDDALAEGNETFSIVLSNVVGASFGSPVSATVTINDNETVTGSNPIFNTPFFVREHYLDFLSREPEVGEPWTAVLNNCSDVNNNPLCDRLTVSAAFFGSPEFQLKGYFVYRFYKLAFNRLPTYPEIVTDMRAVTGQTPAEVFQKKAAFSNAFVQRLEFANSYGALTDGAYVAALMGRYSLTQITTPDPAAPDGTNKVTLTTGDLTTQLSGGTLTRAQVLRAIADSDQVASLEFNQAFVAMQYYGYLRRAPETAGYNAWLAYLTAHPTDSRTMVNGFMNSAEYRLRFGPP